MRAVNVPWASFWQVALRVPGKGDLNDCLGFDKTDPNELISAYNEGTQECWQILSKGWPSSGWHLA